MTKKSGTDVSENCVDCNAALASNARYCLVRWEGREKKELTRNKKQECGLKQPTAVAFKCKTRKHVAGADLLEVEKLIEAAEQKVEELSKKNAAAAAAAGGGGGGGGASAAELAKANAEVAKWKNLFQAAAADVDEKVWFRAFLLCFSLTLMEG
jgi:hypothetical protein